MSWITALYWLLAAATIGSLIYCCMALYGAVRYLWERRRWALETVLQSYTPPVSLLKPLHGLDRGLEENLRSFCLQDYPTYEILFSVRHQSDPAVELVRRLEKSFPTIPMRLLVLGEPRYLNAKVHGLEAMQEAAAHEILVITDSDVRVAPDHLRSVVAPLTDPTVGMVTCISRGAAGQSLWSRLEALSMNTQFIPGILTAWVLIGIEFSLGPTMVIRKKTLGQLGGFGMLGDYLADDFVLGEKVAHSGKSVVLAGAVPDHLVCNESLAASLRHRLRWERSSRRSRPAGYVGQLFMHTFPLALLAWAAAPEASLPAFALLLGSLAMRWLLAWVTCRGVLRDKDYQRDWWLVPLQDLISFGIWCWAFFGREIEWRGARFRVLRGGKLERVAQRQEKAGPSSSRRAGTHSG
ncbi:MAG: bacteriohopanetetrol glucosamine biosynthesis glycosyltransferase HpnI [Acidobacteria bacterium]|nr:bacteriohopanetetrol glucosamine biosynthesis glycosyltransferase HpnI [Acidobacteriota bacterium]